MSLDNQSNLREKLTKCMLTADLILLWKTKHKTKTTETKEGSQ